MLPGVEDTPEGKTVYIQAHGEGISIILCNCVLCKVCEVKGAKHCYYCATVLSW